ncbi:MAG: hypothetical protein NZ551_08535 [Microscillaceae bacterium]|nr:hypothetical protein [Microscillaceae bacterium]MDW8461246.1 hypothetical protein [Cytophagales bacterium]
MKEILFAWSLLGLLGLSACVSMQKYNDLQGKYNLSLEENKKNQIEIEQHKAFKESLKRENLRLAEENIALQDSIKHLTQLAENQKKELESRFFQLNKIYQALIKEQYKDQILIARKDSILQQIGLDLLEMEQQAETQRKALAQCQSLVAKKDTALKEANLFIMNLEKDLEVQEEKLQDKIIALRELTQKYQSLRDSIAQAIQRQDSLANQIAIELAHSLKDYQEDNLRINTYGGYIFLVMPNKLLFSPNQKELEKDGIDILKNVAQTVRKQKNSIAMQVMNEQSKTQEQTNKLIIRKLHEEGITDVKPKEPFMLASPTRVEEYAEENEEAQTTLILRVK